MNHKEKTERLRAALARFREGIPEDTAMDVLDALMEAEVIVPVRVVVSRKAEAIAKAQPDDTPFEAMREEDRKAFEDGIFYVPFLLRETVREGEEEQMTEWMLVFSSEEELTEEVRTGSMHRYSVFDAIALAEWQGTDVGISLDPFSSDFRIRAPFFPAYRNYWQKVLMRKTGAE